MGEETKTLENRKKNKHRAENFVTVLYTSTNNDKHDRCAF